MSISVSIGNNGSLSPAILTDLKDAFAKIKATSLLSLGHQLDAYLDQPLSAVPDYLRSATLEYTSGNQCWTPGDLSFTLSGGVCGKLSLLTSGDLLSYTNDFPTTVTLGSLANTEAPHKGAVKPQITAPDAYICLELDFTLSGGASISATEGIYGVSADGSASSGVTVAFYKHCLITDTVKSAFTKAFEGFVLPLHSNTLTNLAVGDYLHYTCNAKFELGLGATVGVDKVLYSAQYKNDVPYTGSALSIDAKLDPEVQAGAKLAFDYAYSGTFEVVLWVSAPNVAHLHLYRSATQDTSLGLNVGITATAGSSLKLGLSPSVVEDALAKRFPALKDPSFKSSVFGPASDEVGKYITEVNTKMGKWLVSLNGQKATLDACIEKTQDNFLLTNYTIDLTKPWQPAWKLMLAGKFLEAFGLTGSGVSLDTGSGLEKVFSKTNSLKLNLFGKLKDSWSTSDIASSKLIYAGNNHFQLISNVGQSLLTQINNGKKEIDIYFAATVDLTTDNAPAQPTINLHVVLQAFKDQKFGGYIANMVGLLLQGHDARQLTQPILAMAAQPGTTELLHLIFSPDTYTHKLVASTFTNGKLDNDFPDANNFAVFATACTNLFNMQQPENFNYNGQALNYALWSRVNILANDSAAPANAKPNRHDYGNPAAVTPYLDQHGFTGVETPIWATLDVGRCFMNLCDDLQHLAATTSDTTLSSWENLVKRLQTIITNDVNVDFIPPTALALANLCGTAPASTTGPAPGLATGNSIGITMTY